MSGDASEVSENLPSWLRSRRVSFVFVVEISTSYDTSATRVWDKRESLHNLIEPQARDPSPRPGQYTRDASALAGWQLRLSGKLETSVCV